MEKESQVGGLCRSIEHEGGVFDIGGHSFHTPFPEVRHLVESLMCDNWETQQRDARVYSHGELIPYPFQKHFEQLHDLKIVGECRDGLLRAAGAEKARNFEEYIVGRFGTGVAKHFMLPYNRKLWARDLKKLSCEWTGQRVAAPKGVIEHFDTQGGERKPLQPDTMVGYPAKGGYVEIFKSFVPHVPRVEVNQGVVRIDPVGKVVETGSGLLVKWQSLVSTMPLPHLLRVLAGTHDHLLRLVDQLEYMSLNLLLVLVRRQLPSAPHRIYVADPDVPPHKIAFNHTSSRSLAEKPVHAIMAEISYSPEKPLAGKEEIERKTVDFLVNADVLESSSDVAWIDHLDVRYAYPVYTHERPSIVSEIKAYLRQFEIFTLGRFGEWEYINSDKCIMKGIDLAERLERDLLTAPVLGYRES